MRSIVLMTGMVLGVMAFLALIGVAATLADTHANMCALTEDMIPRYDTEDRQLVLADLGTNDTVRVLETALDATAIIGWSPYCRYLVGVVGPVTRADVPAETLNEPVGWYLSLVHDVVFWDVTTGERAATFELPYRRFDAPQVSWDASSSQATIQTGDGQILWQPEADNYSSAQGMAAAR